MEDPDLSKVCFYLGRVWPPKYSNILSFTTCVIVAGQHYRSCRNHFLLKNFEFSSKNEHQELVVKAEDRADSVTLASDKKV